MKVSKQNQIDPLFVIFEQHLYNFQDSDLDRKTFVENVTKEYITLLRKMRLSIPVNLERSISEELYDHVHTMLVKKMYGCLTIQDYQAGLQTKTKRRAKKKYTRLRKNVGV